MPRKERDEKRRDSKGRLLKSGESQRSDGRYAYKYTLTPLEKPQFVYSWKLVPTDKVPAGKRPRLSLREKSQADTEGPCRRDRPHRQENDGLPALCQVHPAARESCGKGRKRAASS